ncbi:hypothetical protein HPB48_001901 [Haemaphysalis longicornis]|uniref:Uncharacterized protein n=1 Tax=Haemaphysalis longicornis TaxID=44386 RepID=A0A9J6G672_HAELO|nr:hypothetical protein HPB48_001901 [Haemaphysalis longicornis]
MFERLDKPARTFCRVRMAANPSTSGSQFTDPRTDQPHKKRWFATARVKSSVWSGVCVSFMSPAFPRSTWAFFRSPVARLPIFASALRLFRPPVPLAGCLTQCAGGAAPILAAAESHEPDGTSFAVPSNGGRNRGLQRRWDCGLLMGAARGPGRLLLLPGGSMARGLSPTEYEHLLRSPNVRNVTTQLGQTMYLHCVVDSASDRMQHHTSPSGVENVPVTSTPTGILPLTGLGVLSSRSRTPRALCPGVVSASVVCRASAEENKNAVAGHEHALFMALFATRQFSFAATKLFGAEQGEGRDTGPSRAPTAMAPAAQAGVEILEQMREPSFCLLAVPKSARLDVTGATTETRPKLAAAPASSGVPPPPSRQSTLKLRRPGDWRRRRSENVNPNKAAMCRRTRAWRCRDCREIKEENRRSARRRNVVMAENVK